MKVGEKLCIQKFEEGLFKPTAFQPMYIFICCILSLNENCIDRKYLAFSS